MPASHKTFSAGNIWFGRVLHEHIIATHEMTVVGFNNMIHGDASSICARFGSTGAVHGAAARAVVEHDDAERRVPGAQLAQPLAQHGGGAHDEGGPEKAAGVQARQEHHQLDGLSQPCSTAWMTHVVVAGVTSASPSPGKLRIVLKQRTHCLRTSCVARDDY